MIDDLHIRIAVNTRFLLPNRLEGIGWFTYEVFKRLSKSHPEVEWIFLFDRSYSNDYVFSNNITPLVISPPARHPFLWYIWFEHSVPRALAKHTPDLFISPDGYLSLKTKIKSLPIIHDLNFEHYPEYLPPLARYYHLRYFKKYAHKASRIVTVSEYSKQDITQTYQVDQNKIDVVYNGISDFFYPLSEEEQKVIRQRISNGFPYLIFIGALNPRKNISGMLKAFEIYRQRGGQNYFVIVGDKMFWSKQMAQVYDWHPYKENIIFTGKLEGKGLNEVLSSSSVLLFASHFEGFGIPIVEAFQCEVPVITSTTTCMPEVAGDAALFCNPNDINNIAEAMKKVENQDVRKNLIQKGKQRGRQFSWDRSAKMMWDSIVKTLT